MKIYHSNYNNNKHYDSNKINKIFVVISLVIVVLSITLLSTVLSPVKIFAQGGSNYSIFGIGDIVYGQSASAQAMGGAQIAVPSTNTINLLNPALWATVKTTRVQTGYRFNQNSITSEEGSILQNNGALNGFSTVFNFDTTLEISAGLLFQPVSYVNYYLASPIVVNSDGLYASGQKLYKGSGGVSNLTLGLGAKLFDGFYLGGTVAGDIGKIDRNIFINFAAEDLTDYQINYTDILSGLNLRIGIFATPIANLSLGAFYEHHNDAKIEARTEYLYEHSHIFDDNINGMKDTALLNNHSMEMPDFWGLGASYIIGKYLIAADYLFGNFSNFAMNNSTVSENNYNNMQKISLGVNIMGNPNIFASLVDRISYKFGAYYEQLYYSVNSKKINEYAITGGFQFPISRTAQIDFSLVLGTRGTKDSELIKENFARIIIEISIGDNWFNPLKPSY